MRHVTQLYETYRDYTDYPEGVARSRQVRSEWRVPTERERAEYDIRTETAHGVTYHRLYPMLYHAHVQHPMGSGYMMQEGSFHNAEEAVARYLELVDADSNPFGRNALLRNPEPLRVLLIPGDLRGPDAMAYTGFCSVWNEDASDAYPTEEPEYVSIPNPRFKGKQYPTHYHSGAGLHGYLYQDGPNFHETYEEAVESLVGTYELGKKRARVLRRDGYLDLNLRRDGNEYCEVTECQEEDCWKD